MWFSFKLCKYQKPVLRIKSFTNQTISGKKKIKPLLDQQKKNKHHQTWPLHQLTHWSLISASKRNCVHYVEQPFPKSKTKS